MTEVIAEKPNKSQTYYYKHREEILEKRRGAPRQINKLTEEEKRQKRSEQNRRYYEKKREEILQKMQKNRHDVMKKEIEQAVQQLFENEVEKEKLLQVINPNIPDENKLNVLVTMTMNIEKAKKC